MQQARSSKREPAASASLRCYTSCATYPSTQLHNSQELRGGGSFCCGCSLEPCIQGECFLQALCLHQGIVTWFNYYCSLVSSIAILNNRRGTIHRQYYSFTIHTLVKDSIAKDKSPSIYLPWIKLLIFRF